jgi:hypothetical protein
MNKEPKSWKTKNFPETLTGTWNHSEDRSEEGNWVKKIVWHENAITIDHLESTQWIIYNQNGEHESEWRA